MLMGSPIQQRMKRYRRRDAMRRSCFAAPGAADAIMEAADAGIAIITASPKAFLFSTGGGARFLKERRVVGSSIRPPASSRQGSARWHHAGHITSPVRSASSRSGVDL